MFEVEGSVVVARRTRRARRRGFGGVVLALLLAVTGSSCQLDKRHWTYRLTRDAAERGYWNVATPVVDGDTSSGANPWGLAGLLGTVLLLPPILDTAFLPIAVTHDLCFVDG